MSIRKFLFCDFCNPEGIRVLDDRRSRRRRTGISGRRYNDSRIWFEGTVEEAVSSYGWVVSDNGKHICPDCKQRLASWPGKRLGDFALSA